VVAGTASAVSGRVHHHQQEKWAQEQQEEYEEQMAQQAAMQAPPPQPAPAPAAGQDDMIEQLNKLASLHDAGVLTDDEFAAAKAKLLDA
jgi:hypothetical protein